MGLACFGGYNIYKIYKPLPIQKTEPINLRSELNRIGVLKVAESKRKYKETFINGRLFKTKFHLIQEFEAFAEYDLGNVVIQEDIENKSVRVMLFKDKLTISPPRLIKDDSYTENNIISKSFTNEEIKNIHKKAIKEIQKAFNNDIELIDEGLKSLEEKIRELARIMGFIKINIIINEV